VFENAVILRLTVRYAKKAISMASLQVEAIVICSRLWAGFRFWGRDRLNVQKVQQNHLACMARGIEPMLDESQAILEHPPT
jgi:hypothetical protein